MTTNNHSTDQQQYRPDGSTESQSGLGGMMDRAEEKVMEVGHDAMKAMDGKRTATADSLASAATSLHSGADKAAEFGQKRGEQVSNLAHGAADKLQSGAEYLRDHDFKDMMHSVEGFVRRNPGQALVAAGVVGFLAARVMRHD